MGDGLDEQILEGAAVGTIERGVVDVEQGVGLRPRDRVSAAGEQDALDQSGVDDVDRARVVDAALAWSALRR